MSRKRAPRRVLLGRAACADEFEPLWMPAPWVPRVPGRSALEIADVREAAKRTAFAWLSAQIGRTVTAFDDLKTEAECETAWKAIRRATLLTVRRWADAQEAA